MLSCAGSWYAQQSVKLETGQGSDTIADFISGMPAMSGGQSMPQIERSALVFYSCQQMYQLVNDVPSYPQFLPGCVAATVLSANDMQQTARLEISKAGIKQSFTTQNILQPFDRIGMQLVDGPFKFLRGGWQFVPLNEQACKVVLTLEFEFSSKLIEFAFGKIFNELTASMVQAFTNRAKQVYGVQHG